MKRWIAFAHVIGLGILGVASFAPYAQGASVEASLARLGRGIDSVALTDHAGKNVRWSDLNGQPRAVFFGFTRCPVICPVTVWELDTALEKIGPAGKSMQIDFVSLDPKRDTPEILRSYFSSFKGRVRALTGTDRSLNRIAEAFEVEHRKVALQGNDYTLDHTAAVFLLDARGNVLDTIAYGTPQDVIVERLNRLLAPRAN